VANDANATCEAQRMRQQQTIGLHKMNFSLSDFKTGLYGVVTRSGLEVVDVGVGKNSSTIILDRNGDMFLENHNINGFVNADESKHDNDLLMYKLEPKK